MQQTPGRGFEPFPLVPEEQGKSTKYKGKGAKAQKRKSAKAHKRKSERSPRLVLLCFAAPEGLPAHTEQTPGEVLSRSPLYLKSRAKVQSTRAKGQKRKSA
jgi:hypothetical protein